MFILFSVWKAVGVSSTQLGRDMMENMTQEFIIEQDGENMLNKEIDNLLDGIDFLQSMSQEKSPTSIPSTYPEEDRSYNFQKDEINREEEMSSPLLFTQEECNTEEQIANPMDILDEETSVPIIQSFTCSE